MWPLVHSVCISVCCFQVSRSHSLSDSLWHCAEWADGALVDEDQVVINVVLKISLDDEADNTDRAVVHLGSARLDRDSVDIVLSWYDIDANVLDGPLLVVGGDHVEVGALVPIAAICLIAQTVFTFVVRVFDGFELFLSPFIFEAVRVSGNGNRAIEVFDEVLV